jgi:putative transcriptional regulator
VEALMSVDEERGGEMLMGFLHTGGSDAASSAVADIREFESGVGIDRFCRTVGAVPLAPAGHRAGSVYGYTVIDSVKAITELSFSELVKLYGVTTQRALVFTNITTGKGPMIAIKVANLRPALVVLHNILLSDVSGVAKNIASAEGIPIAVCNGPSIEELIERLKSIH